MNIDYCVGVTNCCGEHQFLRLASKIFQTKCLTTKNQTQFIFHKSLFLGDLFLFIEQKTNKQEQRNKMNKKNKKISNKFK